MPTLFKVFVTKYYYTGFSPEICEGMSHLPRKSDFIKNSYYIRDLTQTILLDEKLSPFLNTPPFVHFIYLMKMIEKY